MGASGFVYVLINPSMNGIVKIGRTTRDPNERIEELSSATGVPTPFILIYKEKFEDCVQAETIIHKILDDKNCRVSKNREFFQIPPYEVIPIIQNIKEQIGDLPNLDKDNKENDSNFHYAESVFEEALKHYFGLGDYVQDFEEALEMFKKAAVLNHGPAYKKIGLMNLLGQGCRKNVTSAIKFLKKGIEQNDNSCYALLAIIYTTQKNQINKENSKKCWDNYFNSLIFHDLNEEEVMFITHFMVLQKIPINKENRKIQLDRRIINLEREIVNYLNRKKKRLSETAGSVSDKIISQIEKNLIMTFSFPIYLTIYDVEDLVKGYYYSNSKYPKYGTLAYVGEEVPSWTGESQSYPYFKSTSKPQNLFMPSETLLEGDLKAIITEENIQFYIEHFTKNVFKGAKVDLA